MTNDLFVLLLLVTSFVLYYLHLWGQPDPREFFSPPSILILILFFYAVMAPVEGILDRNTFWVLFDARPYFIWGWLGALVFFLAVLLGYHQLGPMRSSRKALPSLPPDRLARIGVGLCLVAVVGQGLSAGFEFLATVNPLEARQLETTQGLFQVRLGALSRYFAYLINLMIPGVLFSTSAFSTPAGA